MNDSAGKPLLMSAKGKDAGQHKIKPQRYIIVHPQEINLPYITDAQKAASRQLSEKTRITFADLTPHQAKELEGILAQVNGTIEINAKRTLNDPIPELDTDVDILSVQATPTAATTPYPNAPPTCPKIKMSDDFIVFFPDTMVNLKNFPAANLRIGNNYSGSPVPCNPHSSYTYSVFKQVLGDAQLEAVNIPVFGCGGHGSIEDVTKGLLDIVEYKKANPLKRVAMFYAVSGGGSSATETAAVQELVNLGVMVGVSAGNNGSNLCNKDIPPWNVKGVMQIGATMPPGDRCPYFTNWSDVVPNPKFGNCVNAYLPGVFKIKQFNKPEKGTSFAVPQAVAWVLRWWNEHPLAKASEAIQAFMDHTVTIHKGGQSYYPPLTTDGLIRVVKTTGYCSTNVTPSPRP